MGNSANILTETISANVRFLCEAFSLENDKKFKLQMCNFLSMATSTLSSCFPFNIKEESYLIKEDLSREIQNSFGKEIPTGLDYNGLCEIVIDQTVAAVCEFKRANPMEEEQQKGL